MQQLSPSKFNSFLFFKLPSAYWCGVRVKAISGESCIVSVKHKWINQNPFKSMYFAVQAMAAELSTGALVISKIKQSQQSISMLVVSNKSSFSKKATGRINFTCNDGLKIDQAVKQTIATKQGQTFWMKSIGIDQNGDQVAEFEFEWAIKAKLKK